MNTTHDHKTPLSMSVRSYIPIGIALVATGIVLTTTPAPTSPPRAGTAQIAHAARVESSLPVPAQLGLFGPGVLSTGTGGTAAPLDAPPDPCAHAECNDPNPPGNALHPQPLLPGHSLPGHSDAPPDPCAHALCNDPHS